MDELLTPSSYVLTDNPDTKNTYDLTMTWEGISTEDATALIKVLVRHQDPETGPRY